VSIRSPFVTFQRHVGAWYGAAIVHRLSSAGGLVSSSADGMRMPQYAQMDEPRRGTLTFRSGSARGDIPSVKLKSVCCSMLTSEYYYCDY
jgi:hypothetical protein